MRVAVLGQGSIGRRHAGLLRDMGHEVVAYDPASAGSAPPVEGTEAATDEAAALRGADAAVIATPSSSHLRHAGLAVEAGVGVLVEKPLAVGPSGVDDLLAAAARRGVVLGVAMNLRFHAGVLRIRELIEAGAAGSVLRADISCGSWLPGWRPGSDYRVSYSARRDLGGGVLLDAIHELDYLTWILGPARAVTATLGRVSELEIDVEDVALATIELESGALASVTLDYVDRSYHRGARIVGSAASLAWRWSDAVVEVLCDGSPPVRHDASCDLSETYAAELRAFLHAVAAGSEPPVTGAEGLAALRLVDAIRRSAADGRRVTVEQGLARTNRPARTTGRDPQAD